VASAVEATHITSVLAIETSAQEAAVVWDSTIVCIRDAEEWVALVEREVRERVSRVEAKNAAVLASTHDIVEGLVWKVALLEGELAERHRTREMAEENFYGLSDVAVDGVRRLVVSEREHREQFEELNLL
jgi:translation elongation factor EF-4